MVLFSKSKSGISKTGIAGPVVGRSGSLVACSGWAGPISASKSKYSDGLVA